MLNSKDIINQYSSIAFTAISYNSVCVHECVVCESAFYCVTQYLGKSEQKANRGVRTASVSARQEYTAGEHLQMQKNKSDGRGRYLGVKNRGFISL